MDGDLNALTISGNPALGDLAEAWSNIYAEYLELNNDNETIYLIELQKDIALLYDLLIETESALHFLKMALVPGCGFIYREELVAILKERDFDFPFDLNDRQQFEQSIEAVDNRLSPLRLQLEMKEKEYNDYMANKGEQTIDKNYFDKMLSRIARFRRVTIIRAFEITVKEFVIMVADYLDYYKAKQPKIEKDGDTW